jgi:hypothetical protein
MAAAVIDGPHPTTTTRHTLDISKWQLMAHSAGNDAEPRFPLSTQERAYCWQSLATGRNLRPTMSTCITRSLRQDLPYLTPNT